MQVLHEYSRSPLHVYPRAIYAPARARLEEVRAAILKEKQRQQRQQRKQQTTNNNDKDIDDNLPLGFVDLQQHERSVLLTELSTREIVSNKGDQSAGASYWAGVCAAAVAAVPSVILSSPRQVRLVAVSQ